MNEKDLLTILVPLKGREDYTMRFLTYCQLVDCPFEVILLDGGLPNDLENFSKDFPFVRYERCEYDKTIKHFVSKMAYGHSLVKTPFVMAMDNDDFFDVSGLLYACNFLLKNKSFSSFCGDVRSFILNADSVMPDRSIYTKSSIFGKTEKERIENCFKNFHSFWHNLTWTWQAEMVYKLIEAAEISDLKFVSMLQSCLLSIMGEIERNNQVSYYFHQTNSPEVEGIDRAGNSDWILRDNWISNFAAAKRCVSVISGLENLTIFKNSFMDFLVQNTDPYHSFCKERKEQLFQKIKNGSYSLPKTIIKNIERVAYFANLSTPARKIPRELNLPSKNDGSDEFFYDLQYYFQKL